MRNLVITACIFISALSLSAQTTFYKNFWGVMGPPNWNVPILSSLDPTSDGGFIITSSNQQTGVVSYLKLDSNFQMVWTSDYTISSTGHTDRAVELDDKGFVSIYMYDQFDCCFAKHDSAGNIQFNNYYHTASSTNFITSSICRSQSNDSGFVVMYAGCELHYGLTKFDKNGDVVWCYDYSTNGVNAGIYELIPAINHGYLTAGVHPNAAIGHSAPVIAQFDNNGNAYRSREYILDSARSGWMDRLTSGVDNCYYTAGVTQIDAPLYTYDPWTYLTQLDTNLNMTKCWKLHPPAVNRKINVQNILSMPDSTLIINGTMTDTLGGARQFFIMKFNPKGTGNVVWCKNWISPNVQPNAFSTSETGLFRYGANQNLVTPALSNYDGVCVLSIDSSGNGLCNTQNENITSTVHTGFTSAPVTLYQISIPLLKYQMAMNPATVAYTDSLLCGTLPTSIVSPVQGAHVELISASCIDHTIRVQNNSNAVLSISVFDVTGKSVAEFSLQPNERNQIAAPATGAYFIRAHSVGNVEVEKVVVAEH